MQAPAWGETLPAVFVKREPLSLRWHAGMMDEMKPVGEVDEDLYHRVMTLNAKSPMLAMQRAIQVM